jgi:hypothetical protein
MSKLPSSLRVALSRPAGTARAMLAFDTPHARAACPSVYPVRPFDEPHRAVHCYTASARARRRVQTHRDPELPGQ